MSTRERSTAISKHLAIARGWSGKPASKYPLYESSSPKIPGKIYLPACNSYHYASRLKQEFISTSELSPGNPIAQIFFFPFVLFLLISSSIRLITQIFWHTFVEMEVGRRVDNCSLQAGLGTLREKPMTKRDAVAYHVAGHVVMACLRKVDFESVTILQNFCYACGIDGCNYQSSVPNDLDRVGMQVCTDVRRIEIGLAGPFAHGLYVGEFTPGNEATETHKRALDAHVKGSEDLAVLNALAGEVKHLNASVNGDIIDKVIWSPSARTILFDLSDHWDQVEAVATALIARESLSQVQVHRIIQAEEAQRGLQTRPIKRARVKKVAGW